MGVTRVPICARPRWFSGPFLWGLRRRDTRRASTSQWRVFAGFCALEVDNSAVVAVRAHAGRVGALDGRCRRAGRFYRRISLCGTALALDGAEEGLQVDLVVQLDQQETCLIDICRGSAETTSSCAVDARSRSMGALVPLGHTASQPLGLAPCAPCGRFSPNHTSAVWFFSLTPSLTTFSWLQ